MCNPLALTVLSVGSSVMQYVQQQQMRDANIKASNNALINEGSQLRLREGQEQTKAAQEKFDKRLEGQAAIATNRVAEGESGTVLANDAANVDIIRKIGFSNAAIDANLAMTKNSLASEYQGAVSRRNSRINETPGGNLLATGLQIGSAVAGGYSLAGQNGGWTNSFGTTAAKTAAASSGTFTPYPGAKAIKY